MIPPPFPPIEPKDANPPSTFLLQQRIDHLQADLVTVSAQLAVACKERDQAELDVVRWRAAFREKDAAKECLRVQCNEITAELQQYKLSTL